MKYFNHQGIKITKALNPIEVESLKVNNDDNFNKKLNEVSQEIQRRRSIYPRSF